MSTGGGAGVRCSFVLGALGLVSSGCGAFGAGGGPPAFDQPLACEDEVDRPRHSGHHNPGKVCTDCHNGRTEAPLFTVSGTIYVDPDGSKPAPGVSIHILDAAGQSLTLVAARNGNFFSEEPVTYPLRTYASICPKSLEMPDVVAAPGNCNAKGCHDKGRRIYTP